MSSYTLTIYDPAAGVTVADYTQRAIDPQVTNASASFVVNLAAHEAAQYVDTTRQLQLIVTKWGKRAVYRLATPALLSTGARFESHSPIVALDDDQYTDLWSDTRVASWLTLNPDYAARYGDNWTIDTNNRLFLALTNNATYPNGTGVAGLGYIAAAGGTQPIAVVQFDVAFVNIPANFRWQVVRANRDFSSLTAQTFLLSPGTSTYAFCLSLTTPMDLVAFELFNLTGAPYLYAGETGAAYAKMTNARVATSVTNLVNTTVTSGAIGIGAASPTVSSVANMYIGQRLVINSGAADSESVVVTAVGATTFTATFAKAHAANATVRAIVVYDKEIVEHVLSQVTTLNPTGGLRTAAALIQSSGRDLFDKGWIDASPRDVLRELAAPADYVYGVRPDGVLFYAPRGTGARAWLVRAAEIELSRPVEGLVNSVRAAYTSGGQRAVTAYATDSVSVGANGLTRRRTVDANTGSGTEATTIRDTYLSDRKTRAARSSITFRRLFDRAGVEYPVDSIRPGDTITIGNLPASLSSQALRTFTVAEASVDLKTGRPSVVPEAPLPRLDVLLAQLALT